jgi:O-antigen/teichoic acid export membrane protein
MMSTESSATLSATPCAPVVEANSGGRMAAASQGALTMADQAIVSGASFCATWLVGRFATQQEFGIFALGLTITFFALAVQHSLVCLPLTIFSARSSGLDRRRLAGSTLVHAVGSATAASMMLALAAFGVHSFVPAAGFAALLAALAVAVPFILLREFVRRFEFAHLRSGRALAVDLAAAALQIAGLSYLATTNRLTAASAIACTGAALAIAGIAWLLAARGEFAFDPSRVLGDLARHVRLGQWVLAGSLVTLTNAYVLHWLLLIRFGPTATGALAASLTLIDLSNPFMLGMSSFVSPRAARAWHRGGMRDLRELVGRTTLFIAVCMAAFAAAVAWWGADIVRLWFRPEIEPTSVIVGLLALGAFALSLGMAPAEGLTAMERPRLNFVASCAALLATMITTAALLPPLGLAGAAAAILTGYATASLLRTLFFWWSTVPLESSEGNA